MNKSAILFGLSLGLLLILLKSIQYLFLTYTVSFEFYAGLVGAAFFIIGIWAGVKLNDKRRTADQAVEPSVSELKAEEVGLSAREIDVLVQLSMGLSNQEIAEKLFVSLNTVKTHIANIYSKLHVKRRTQAISKAKALGVIA